MSNLKWQVGERVKHEYLGSGEVTKVIKSAMDSRVNAGYLVLFDERPAVEYNMGKNLCLVFPSSLDCEVNDE